MKSRRIRLRVSICLGCVDKSKQLQRAIFDILQIFKILELGMVFRFHVPRPKTAKTEKERRTLQKVLNVDK